MTTWTYRVIRRKEGEYVSFGIHEVYDYDDEYGEGWTMDQCHPLGESVDELADDLRMMLAALNKPVLEEYTDKDGNEKLRPAE